MRESGSNTVALPREQWDDWDPTLISEGLFAAANIFSSLKLVYIFSVNPYLGPLQVGEKFIVSIVPFCAIALSSYFNFFNLFQVSLSRMVIDIIKFTFLYLLVLFAFSCGEARLDK